MAAKLWLTRVPQLALHHLLAFLVPVSQLYSPHSRHTYTNIWNSPRFPASTRVPTSAGWSRVSTAWLSGRKIIVYIDIQMLPVSSSMNANFGELSCECEVRRGRNRSQDHRCGCLRKINAGTENYERWFGKGRNICAEHRSEQEKIPRTPEGYSEASSDCYVNALQIGICEKHEAEGIHISGVRAHSRRLSKTSNPINLASLSSALSML